MEMINGSIGFSNNSLANDAITVGLCMILGIEAEDMGNCVIVVLHRAESGTKCRNPDCGGFHRIAVVSSSPQSFVTASILDKGIKAVEAAPFVNGWDDVRNT